MDESISYYDKQRAVQLGMPIGTATNQLRKAIMFHLIVKLGENRCFKCGEYIETVHDMTIEHKQPWFDVSPDLFWDMNNIAFSHVKCNRPDRKGGHKLRFIGPAGTYWCQGHKCFLKAELFNVDNTNWNKHSRICRDCQSVKNARYRQNVKDKAK